MTEQTNPDFPSEPLLRLNAEGHVGAINRTDVDAAGHTLVSGSDDKTIKLWRLADGTLERTLRLPQWTHNLGKVKAVAISPDGSEVAAGGWTSVDGLKTAIYIFDRTTGALKHHIGGLPNVVTYLAYAADGQRLVAILPRHYGIRLYETRGYREIGSDSNYGDTSFGADFAADGRLVTTSYDGRLRLYGPDGDRVQTVEALGGKRPYGIAFSPDGHRIAVGYDDSNRVEVLDGRTLKRLYAADTLDVNHGNLISVAWSADGETLLAGGTFGDDNWNPIRRWTAAGLGPYDELLVAIDTIVALHPLTD